MTGIGNLCLHRMSKTSSKNPSIVAIRRDSRDERYTASLYFHALGTCGSNQLRITHLVMRELVHYEPFARPLWRAIMLRDRLGESVRNK